MEKETRTLLDYRLDDLKVLQKAVMAQWSSIKIDNGKFNEWVSLDIWRARIGNAIIEKEKGK